MSNLEPALQMDVSGVIPVGTSEGEQMEDALDTRAFTIHSEIDGDGPTAEAAKTDPGAFGELYERYYPRVYRYVYHRVGSYPEAEDITAIAFMKALEGLSSYESRRNGFAPWLFRITRNCVVDHYRRRKQQSPLDAETHLSGDGDPMGHVLGTERRAELAALVQHLSAEQRDVVLMRYAGDLTFSEIAAALGKKEPAVRMLLHRGLRKLKAVMDDE